jgi:hypothetical protein
MSRQRKCENEKENSQEEKNAAEKKGTPRSTSFSVGPARSTRPALQLLRQLSEMGAGISFSFRNKNSIAMLAEERLEREKLAQDKTDLEAQLARFKLEKHQEEEKAAKETEALLAKERLEREKLERDKTDLEAQLARVKLEKRQDEEKAVKATEALLTKLARDKTDLEAKLARANLEKRQEEEKAAKAAAAAEEARRVIV